jgi:hypothetical protein
VNFLFAELGRADLFWRSATFDHQILECSSDGKRTRVITYLSRKGGRHTKKGGQACPQLSKIRLTRHRGFRDDDPLLV